MCRVFVIWDTLVMEMVERFMLLQLELFQQQQPTSGGTVRSCRPANCCQHIPSNYFLDGFPDPSQFAAIKLTHQSRNGPRTPRDHGYAS